jgi:hypothetical protein
MILEGKVVNGQILLDRPEALPEGARVRVEIRQLREPRDDWERRLREAASDCGVSIPDSALSSEGLYE